MRKNTSKKPTPKTITNREDPAKAKFKAEFGRGLDEFAGQAYTDAIDYYSKHHDDPIALNELQIRNPGVHPEWVALSEAVAVIATSKAAPEGLKQPVVDFLTSESGAIWGELMVRTPVIQRILVEAKGKETEVSDDEN